MNDSRPAIAVIVGPTAVGKSKLAVDVALAMDGEIVTADSMQVYRGMDIGTDKPTPEQRRGVPHHMIDVCDPDRRFNVAEYRTMAHACIAQILERGRLPIVAGGTGLYIKAILDDFLFPDEGPDYALREELEAEAARRGPAALYERLLQVDPGTARRLHPNDVRRVVRALEVYLRSGKPLSVHIAESAGKKGRYRAVQVGLTRPRPVLYRRIEERVDDQIRRGLVDEVRRLIERYPTMPVARQALGYKEILAYLQGECSLEEAIALLKRNTRRFAKRQFTWFRRDQRIHWFDIEAIENAAGPDEPAAVVVRYLKEALV